MLVGQGYGRVNVEGGGCEIWCLRGINSSLEQVQEKRALRLRRGMESHYTGGYKSPGKQRRRGDALAAYKYTRGVSTREAEELRKLEDEDSVGGGTDSFSGPWEAYLEALQPSPVGGG